MHRDNWIVVANVLMQILRIVANDGACSTSDQHHFWLQQINSCTNSTAVLLMPYLILTTLLQLILLLFLVKTLIVTVHSMHRCLHAGDLADCIQPGMTQLAAPCCMQNTLFTKQLF